MEQIELSNGKLVEIALQCKRDVNACVRELSERYGCLSPTLLFFLKKYITESFLPRLHRLWKNSRSLSKLKRDHSEWLKGTKIIALPAEGMEAASPKKVGRKSKPFDECGP